MTENAIVNPSARNFFEAYGDQTAQRNIIGKLLKFTKGDYTVGQEGEEVPVGTRFAVDMDKGFLIGWVKWVDQKPEEEIMGLLSEGFTPPKRRELSDTDETLWEVDDNGKPRDPWQPTNKVLFKTPGKKRVGDDHVFTFTTSSFGGISNLGKLAKAYGTEMRTRPDQNPIIELGVEKYKHSNAQYGIIKNPTFAIVGWEKKSLFEEAAADEPVAALPKQKRK